MNRFLVSDASFMDYFVISVFSMESSCRSIFIQCVECRTCVCVCDLMLKTQQVKGLGPEPTLLLWVTSLSCCLSNFIILLKSTRLPGFSNIICLLPFVEQSSLSTPSRPYLNEDDQSPLNEVNVRCVLLAADRCVTDSVAPHIAAVFPQRSFSLICRLCQRQISPYSTFVLCGAVWDLCFSHIVLQRSV